ncbi:MAG: HAD family phosphatase [Endomicrobia bacterium]|nr:HAD family phosphatase [Bacillota bacterium]MCL1972268.1 HAD family phosphatase [Endomicrobiia bacterium]
MEVVIFDLGKVIFDFDLTKFTSAFSKKTSKKGEDINKLIFEYWDLAASYETGKITSLEFYEQLAKRTHYRGSYNEFSVIWNDMFTPIAGTIEIIAQTAAKHKVAMLSNTNELHFEFLKAAYPQVFLLFSDFYLSYEMNARKPEDEVYKKVISHYGIEPEKLFFTDDLQQNVDAAVRHGIKAYKFTSPADLKRNLQIEGIQI